LLAENRDQAGRFPAWPVTLIRDLGRAGQATEAVVLSEALAVVDPARHGSFAGEAAVALAEAGLADEARAKVARNTERWPDDVRARVLAGDALAVLGHVEAALAQFQLALLLAQRAKDFKVTRDLSTRIFRLTHPVGDETVQRRQPRARPARSQRKGRR
jgi:thioredoxin-like negative regulator of GroEL